MNQWDIAARELEKETGAIRIHISPGTDPNTTVAQIKDAFYKAIADCKDAEPVEDIDG